MTATTLIKAEKIGVVGRITLTRPEALNAINREMIAAIHGQLDQWRDDPAVKVVVFTGEGRAFCAGGDIKAVWEKAVAAEHTGAFFWEEYRMDYAIHHYPKPVLSLMNGFVMGGGAGISILGKYRVACETTRFAMPETAIGFYPDAGGTFFLSRLEPSLARYLGLTGARIDGADCLYAGLATHFVAQEKFPALIEDLAKTGDVEAVLAAYGQAAPDSALASHRGELDRLFGTDNLAEILTLAQASDSDWGRGVAQGLASVSPSSMALTLLQLRWGKGKSLADCLTMEYRLSIGRTRQNDFKEGVKAKLVEKGATPHWRPETLADVNWPELEALFAPLSEAELLLP